MKTGDKVYTGVQCVAINNHGDTCDKEWKPGSDFIRFYIIGKRSVKYKKYFELLDERGERLNEFWWYHPDSFLPATIVDTPLFKLVGP
jgi:hypothetical protein